MASDTTTTALHRFGLGARPGEATSVGSDAAAWLEAQLTGIDSLLTGYNLAGSKALITLYYDYVRAQQAEMSRAADFGSFARAIEREERLVERPNRRIAEQASMVAADLSGTAATSDDIYQQMVYSLVVDLGARTRHAALTPGSFRERLVRFWSDHFTVSINKLILLPCAASLEREAIRPHVTGRFEDMLVAVETHPAMLAYLDNWISVGPNSPAGSYYGLGLNENLAREILELHTLGVAGGYSQDDVTEFARAITGWTIGNPTLQPDKLGEFIFEPRIHEPGARTVLGLVYGDPGVGQGRGILRTLAGHLSTARHIATKLCRHFISDDPPEAAIADLEAVFNATGGDLKAVSEALIARPEMWAAEFEKMRGAEEFVIAAMRALDKPDFDFGFLFASFDELGQTPFFAPSPAGWPDDTVTWTSPNQVKSRMDWSVLFAADYASTTPPAALARSLMGDFLSDYSHTWIGNASSPAQGAALLLMSPEFQRR